MNTRSWYSTLLLVCAVGGPLACDVDEPTPDVERRIVFHADEIQDALDNDADAVFFVDLREPGTYVFEQPDAPIDRSHFVVQGPGMDYALPLARVLDEAEPGSLDGPSWSLSTSDLAFRGPFHQDPDGGDDGGGCFLVCTSTGSCVLFCPP
ncbi:MAG: hypothetical protein KDK70_20600 [Myxococcales bacterium]|nr:hypothetical protein [Myxococcales bacterium]